MDAPSCSDDDLFITQDTFVENSNNSGNDTDFVNTILDMESVKSMPNFCIKSSLFSDISDEELIKSTDKILKESQENATIQNQNRFVEPMSDVDRDNYSKCRFAKKTEAKTKWAVKLFDEWRASRLALYADRDDIIHVDRDLMNLDSKILDYALGAFIVEIRKENGEEYRGNTLYEIIVAIQHYLRENGRFLTLLDDAEFEGMRQKLDKKMKELAAKGVGIEKQQSCVISLDDEDKMWANGILASNTPDKLRDTILYLLGLNFALRGGQEHYYLRHGQNSQLRLGTHSNGKQYLEYTEDVSKCNPGGIKHRKITRKNTKAYENSASPDRCVVALYQKYISLRYVFFSI